MRIRPAQTSDAAEWLLMRVALWPADPDKEAAEIGHFLAVPPRPRIPFLDAAFVCERPVTGLCGLAEVAMHDAAPGCQTDRIGYLEAAYVLSPAAHAALGYEEVIRHFRKYL